ncbi:hypothetical protein ACFOTA_05460 [Chitinophaga sp. GCM10012297]|uniref:Uncharacterized protein n=1 Tax=Chitinophaga chungangae TaxID=2821488 RepID=A0ABS3YBC4_9BACT|nr:hypothetical protein [Chitinophaga chungangae]MBO9151643.1 hypothetical protein [Chitinophaga chungangae]
MKYTLCLLPALFLFATAGAQTAEYELYKPSPDSCGHVMLYRDGTFYLGGDCTSSPLSTAGSWRQVRDTVFFLPQNPAGIRAVQSTTAFFTPGDTLAVEVLTSSGRNISNRVQLCWRLPDGGGDIPLTSPGNKAYIASPPADGRLLLRVLGQDVELPGGFANNFIVKLNIPEEWATASGWCRQSRFYLLKKDGKLLPPAEPAPVAHR